VKIVRHQLVVGVVSAAAALLIPLLAAAPAAATIRLSLAIEQLYLSVEMEPPSEAQMTVCYGFTCRLRLTLVFTAAERATITNLMNKGHASPAEERKAIQQVFVWFDRRVGREVGTDKRIASADVRSFDAGHNFDCWDTTRNGASLLLVLQEWHLFRHHRVSDPRYRGNILIGQLPHNTAVIKETAAGGTSWVVDMWPTAFGQVPDMMTLQKWLDTI
jgi:hypothetical protein